MSAYTIIVALDFSHVCEQVLESAAQHLKDTGGRAIVVYAVPSYLEFAADAIPHHYLHKMMEEQAADARRKMDDLLPRFLPEGCYSTRIMEGYPADVILQIARDENASVIIVGSHGHRPVHDAFLGSVADKVVRRAHCSVYMVRCDSQKAEASQGGGACCGGGAKGGSCCH